MYLLNQVCIFFLHKIKISKQHRLFSELPLTYTGNVDDLQRVHHPLSTLPVGTKNTLVAFKLNQ